MKNSKNRLIGVISLLLVAGFLVTSLASFFASRSSLRSEIVRNELPLTSDNIYSEIQRDLLRPVFISSLMASDTFLRDWVLQGEQDTAQIAKYLKEIKTKYNTVSSFFVSDITRNYYYGDGILKQVSPDSERDEWYFRNRTLAALYDINVDPDMANKDAMTIFTNYRVFDYQGRYIGATGVGLAVQSVKALIDNYQERYERNIYFVDMSGNITLRGRGAAGGPSNLRDMPGIGPLTDDILSGHDRTLEYQKNGKTIHLNTRFIPEFNWVLLVAQSEAETVRQVLQTLFINLAICFVITTVVILLTNWTISTYQTQLEKLATTDSLTGAHNRRAFGIVLEQMLKEVKREGTPMAIALFDIDHFKQINDRFGHLAGDAVLRELTRVARNRIRAADVLCRWGGEEFIILLKNCNLKDARNTAEQIRIAVSETPVSFRGDVIPVTISLGVARHIPGESVDQLLSRTDKALYAAKQNGRNRTETAAATD